MKKILFVTLILLSIFLIACKQEKEMNVKIFNASTQDINIQIYEEEKIKKEINIKEEDSSNFITTLNNIVTDEIVEDVSLSQCYYKFYIDESVVVITEDNCIIYKGKIYKAKEEIYSILLEKYDINTYTFNDAISVQIYNANTKYTYYLTSDEKIQIFNDTLKTLKYKDIESIEGDIIYQVLLYDKNKSTDKDDIIIKIYSNDKFEIDGKYYMLIDNTFDFIFAYNESNCDSYYKESSWLGWL